MATIDDRVTLRSGIRELLDPDGALTFASVTSSTTNFRPLDGPVPNRGQVKGALWLALPLSNQSSERKRMQLVIDWPRLERVAFFARTASGYRRIGMVDSL